MHIQQLYIKHYGPLKDKDYLFASGFNLLHGPNEQGKSLTLDALVKLLLGKGSKKMPLIDRVQDKPEKFGGFLSLEVKQDKLSKTIKLQGDDNLGKLINLNADECNNLFIIRNSELSIGQDQLDQDRFYTSLTDRLTGLKTSEISQAKDKLRSYAQITDTNRFQNLQENQKLAERLEKAEQFLEPQGELGRLIKQNEQQQWLKLEEEQHQLKTVIDQAQKKLADLELARKKEDYLTAKERVESIKQLQEQLAPLEPISQDILDQFRLANQAQDRLQADIVELEQEISSKEKQLSKIAQELAKLEEQLEEKKPAQQEIESSLHPELAQLTKQYAQVQATKQQPYLAAVLISLLLLTLSLVAYLIQTEPLLSIVVIIFTISTLACLWRWYQQQHKQQQLDTQLNKIKLEAAKYGVKAKQLDELMHQINQVRQNYHTHLGQRSGLISQQKALQEDLNQEKSKKLASLNNQLRTQQETISLIYQDCRVKSLEQLQAKLKEKQRLEQKLRQQLTVIEISFGKAPSNQDPTLFFEKQLATQAHLEQAAPEVKYSAQEYSQCQQDLDSAQKRLLTINDQLINFKEQLKQVERVANQLLVDQSKTVTCDNTTDLFYIKQLVEKLVGQHQQKRDQAIKAIEILDVIEHQEKQKVAELFGEGSLVSQNFSRITNQRYTQVFYDQAESKIKVISQDDTILQAEQLSAGAYDQLYFAIRVTLGQAVLPNQTGFFIMDDPFLKADRARLHQQLSMLLNLAKQGWQIIYFTAKDEVVEFVKQKADKVFSI